MCFVLTRYVKKVVLTHCSTLVLAGSIGWIKFEAAANSPCKAEITQSQQPSIIHQHIWRLEVPVHHPHTVKGGKRSQEL